ncbi:MAG: PspC domain-containing protein, partial [bacterium]|nr:PspC domain-containing protein [bacterium]
MTTSPDLGRVAPLPTGGSGVHSPDDATSPAPRLLRPVEGRVLAGVWAGVGRHLGISPWYLRFGSLVVLPFGV